MKWFDQFQSISATDSLTFFWERNDSIDPGHSGFYEVFLDGRKQKEFSETHVTLDGLKEEKEYSVLIRHISEADSADAETIDEETKLQIKTLKSNGVLDITKAPYFAIGDGKTMNTKAIQQAIDDCKSGQTVLIPEGIFMTGALRLHSDMELYLAENAVLRGTAQPEDYLPRIPSRFEGLEMECYSSLLNLGFLDHNGGYSCENVCIRGKGTIESGGKALAESIIQSEKERLKKELESLGNGVKEFENENTIPGRVRPRLINMSNARNVRISGLTLKNSAAWNVHMIYSDRIITDHCTFHSLNIWNGDGWDPDSSTNCFLFACIFHTGDDSVAIKSGKNPEGNVINKPCEHIRIFDCVCACGLGIAIGSEMSGGVKDVKIWDCDLQNTRYGIEIKGTRKRGGYVKDIQVSNSVISRILFHSVKYNDDGEGAKNPPVFSDCIFDNLTVTGQCLDEHKQNLINCTAIELCGFEKEAYYIDHVTFRNINLKNPVSDSISLKNCKNISFESVNASSDRPRP